MSAIAPSRGRQTPLRAATPPALLQRPELLVGLMTVAALVLRLTQIHQSLYGDEMWTYGDIVHHSLGGTIAVVNTGIENNPPLYFIFAWLSAKLGSPVIWIRLPSLVFGVATVPMVYLLGRETVGRWAGAVGAAIVALGPFTTYYGIEARPYATMAFFVALSTYAVVRAVRSAGPGWWIAYAVATAAAAYTHYTAVFALAAQAAWSLWVCRGRPRAPLLALAGAAALYLPWIGHVSGKGQLSVFSLLEPMTVGSVLSDIVRPLAGYPYAGLSEIPSVPGLVVLALACVAAVTWCLRSARTHAIAGALASARPERVLIGLVALATPVGLLLYSLLITDLWSPRGLSASVPAAALVVAVLLERLPRTARVTAIAVVLAVLALATARSTGPAYARPPFRDAAARLDRIAAPEDPIVMFGSLSNMPASIEIQFGRPHRVIDTHALTWPSGMPQRPVFVVIDGLVARALHLRWPRPAGFRLAGARSYAGVLPFTVLQYAPAGR